MRQHLTRIGLCVAVTFDAIAQTPPPKPPAPPRPPAASARLTAAQLAALAARAVAPEKLGLRVVGDGLVGVNLIEAEKPVTVAMVPLPAPKGAAPSPAVHSPVVAAVVNGQTNVNVLLDSGATSLLVSYSLARQMAIPVIEWPSSGGGVLAMVPELKVGDLVCRNLLGTIGPDLLALGLMGGFRDQSQMIVASLYSFHRGLAYVSLDYPRGMVTFGPRGPYPGDPARKLEAKVPFEWQGSLPYIAVDLGDGESRRCLVDTGSQFGVCVPRAVAEKLGHLKPDQKVSVRTLTVHGVASAVPFTLPRMEMGDRVFADVPAITELSGAGAAGRPLLIGNELLARYRVTFDFQKNMLWLER